MFTQYRRCGAESCWPKCSTSHPHQLLSWFACESDSYQHEAMEWKIWVLILWGRGHNNWWWPPASLLALLRVIKATNPCVSTEKCWRCGKECSHCKYWLCYRIKVQSLKSLNNRVVNSPLPPWLRPCNTYYRPKNIAIVEYTLYMQQGGYNVPTHLAPEVSLKIFLLHAF